MQYATLYNTGCHRIDWTNCKERQSTYKKQFWYNNVGSKIKIFDENMKCGGNENKRFIDTTVTVRAKMCHHQH